MFQWREIGDICDLALGLVSLGWALLVDILQMKDIAFTGLEHTIFTWNIARAGNISNYMHQHNTGIIGQQHLEHHKYQ